jgi:hypothetical protein
MQNSLDFPALSFLSSHGSQHVNTSSSPTNGAGYVRNLKFGFGALTLNRSPLQKRV